MPSPDPQIITYELDKWLQSKWQRDTRFYTLYLWQNIYGALRKSEVRSQESGARSQKSGEIEVYRLF